MTQELVVHPSSRMAMMRLKRVAIATAGLVILVLLIVLLRHPPLVLLLILGGVLVALVFGSLGALLVYIRNAALISGPDYVAWTTFSGRRVQHPTEGLELSRVTSSVSGTSLELLMLAWPAEHKLFRLDLNLWDQAGLDNWLRAVGRPVELAPSSPISELDLPSAYERVLGTPRISDSLFLALVGGAALIAVTGAIYLFYR